jgi:hypothetical protein
VYVGFADGKIRKYCLQKATHSIGVDIENSNQSLVQHVVEKQEEKTTFDTKHK